MANHDEQLLHLHQIVSRSGRVDVVGDPGSGRTRLLQRLGLELQEADWQVTRITGSAALVDTPLAALLIAGLPVPPGVGSLAAASAACVAELVKRSGRGRHLIAVDDWELLDRASQGIIEQASAHAGTSLAITRRSGWTAEALHAAAGSSITSPTLSVALPPLRYEQLHELIHERLGGNVEPSTMSRIYAKTAGNIGLSLALVDAAVQESRLVRRDGSWAAPANMWSPMLSAVIGRFLSPLPDPEREAVEVLSLTGAIDLPTAIDIVGDEVIETLEDRRLVRLHPSARGSLITLVPPLLGEHIRRTQPGTRRARLVALIEQRLAVGHPLWTPPDDDFPRAESPAGLVSIIREQLRTHLVVTNAAWQRHPTADTAVPYLDALLADNTAPDRVEAVLQEAAAAPGSLEFRIRLAVIAAKHRAYTRGQIDEALEDLRRAEQDAGPYTSLPRAWAVAIETVTRAIPADFVARLSQIEEDAFDEPPAAAATRLWIAAMIDTSMGAFASSGQYLDAMRRVLGGALDDRGDLLAGLNLIGQGRLRDAVALAHRRIDAARAAFDIEALRRHAYLASLCYQLQGNYDAIDAIAEEIFGLGDPPEEPQLTHLAMLAICTSAAQRQGRTRLARRYGERLARIEIPDGPLPGMTRSLGDIYVLATATRLEEAAELAQSSADAHWARGFRFHAAFGYCLALDLDPTAARLAAVKERIEAIEGEYFAAQLAYLTALVEQDPQALQASSARLDGAGRSGQAISALRRAGALHAARGDEQEAERAQQLARRLIAANPPGTYDLDRYRRGVAQPLTAREREVALLIARGMTNAEIAAGLSLSTRTVESHINHIIAKTGIAARDDFRRLAARLGDD